MLVYARISGESAPEAFPLSGTEATVAELVDKVSRSRSAAGRRISLPVANGNQSLRLSELGVSAGDLVDLVAEGSPTFETTAPPVAEIPHQEAPPARRRAERLNEYEQLTQLLQWHAPYHISGDRPAHQVWTDESTGLRCSDWEAYRSPDKLYYRTYIAQQAKAERAVSTAFEFAGESEQLQVVSPERVESLRGLLGALQYPDWGLCMLHQHVTRFALSSWIAGAADFMMFDELRHAQLYGRLALAFDGVHGGFDNGSELWMTEPRFQPVRELIELLVAEMDWGKSTLLAGLIVEPYITAVEHALLGSGSLQAGDGLTPFVCASILRDKRRHRESTAAFLHLVSGDEHFGEVNRNVVQAWFDDWLPHAREAVRVLADGNPKALAAIDTATTELEVVTQNSGLTIREMELIAR